jgi:endoglucanase
MKILHLCSPLAAYLLTACALTGCGGGSSDGGTTTNTPAAVSSSVASSSPLSPSRTSSANSTSSSQTSSTQSSASSTVILAAAITAKQAASTMGKGFNLGQMFDNTQNPRTLAAAKAKIDAYYAQGFRNVRIPITWTENVDGTTLVNDSSVGDVNRTHPRLLVIRDVVDYALSLDDMYVVINAHHESALKDNNRAAVLEHLWQDAADIFRDRNHHLLFEILNEPHLSNNNAMDPINLRNMTSKAYKKIRAVDGKRIVIIGGNQWFGANEMANTWPNLNDVGAGLDQYLMAEFHHYNPWTFNGDNQGDYADNWTDADISEPMDTMLSWSNSVGNGMPVYIGEWGSGWGSRYKTFSCNNIRQFYQKLHAKYASSKGMPTTVWDDGGWFKIFDFSTYSFNNNLSQCIGGTCDWDGTERFNSGCL